MLLKGSPNDDIKMYHLAKSTKLKCLRDIQYAPKAMLAPCKVKHKLLIV